VSGEPRITTKKMTELSGGAIAGIVIGTTIALSFIGAFIYFILLHIVRENEKRSDLRRRQLTEEHRRVFVRSAQNARASPSSRNDDNIYVYSVSSGINHDHSPNPPTGGSYTDPGFSVPISPDPGFSVPISPDPGFSVPISPDPGFSMPISPDPGFSVPISPDPGFSMPVDSGWSSGGFDSSYSVDTGGGSYDSGGGSFDSGGGTSSYD
jgi:hypothetical protein